jgi:hypothetical protein
MEKYLEQLFLFELKQQCIFAIQAYNNIVNALKSRDGDNTWLYLELFLIAAAKISIIFWPQRSPYKKRGEELRNLLSIQDTVAFKATGPRNHLEHFDERLEDWYYSSEHGNLMDKSIVPETTINTGKFDYLRAFAENIIATMKTIISPNSKPIVRAK